MALNLEIAEDLLGVPCRTPEIDEKIIPGRVDVRKVISHIVGLMITDVVGRPGRALSDDAREAITTKHGDHIKFLASQATLAERFARSPLIPLDLDDPAGSKGAAARARYQGVMMNTISCHARTIPAERSLPHIINNETLNAVFTDSMLGIAPPGAGKTVIAARTLHQAGIGDTSEKNAFQPTASIIVPDVSLVLQYLGKRGDNLFRRVLGEDVPITALGGDLWDESGRVSIITRQMLARNAAAQRHVAERDFVIFDEGHHGLGPKMRELKEKLGRRTLYLTGTPAYVEDRDDRDLRKSVTYVEVGTPREFAEEGITSPVQLLSFMSDGTNEAQMAASLATEMIKQGIPTAVYCRPGNESQQAQEVARLINEALKEDVAQAIGIFKGSESQDDIVAFEKGDIKALTTVGMLREGASIANIGAVIIMPGGSLLDIAQKAGRATRHGNQISIIAEILSPPRPGRTNYSIWQVYDFDEIPEQGAAVVGDISDCLLAGDKLSLLPTDRDKKTSPHAVVRPGNLLLPSLPPELKAAIAPKGALQDVLIAPEDRARREPPPGYHNLDELAARFEVPKRWLRLYLTTKHNFASVDIIAPTDDERRFAYVRWYEPDALAHLEKNPPPKLATEDFTTRSDIRAMTGLSYDFIDRIINKLGITGEPRLGRKKSQKATHFNQHELEQILQKIAEIPQADSTDVVWKHLKKEVGHSFIISCSERLNITPVYKRRHPSHGVAGFADHVSKGEADRIRQARENLRPPTSDEISLIEVASIANVSESCVVRRNMTPSEKDHIRLRRVVGKSTHDVDHIPRALGLEIAKRLRPVPLRPHLVPLSVMSAILQTSKSGILKHLKGTTHETPVARLRLPHYPASAMSCYSWNALVFLELEKGVKRREGVMAIDYNRVVRSEHDTDKEHWEYTLGILAQYIKAEALASRPAITTVSQVRRKFDCTAATLRVILEQAQPTQEEIELLRSGKVTLSLLERAQQWLDENQKEIPIKGWGKKPPSIVIQGGQVLKLRDSESEEEDELDDDPDETEDLS